MNISAEKNRYLREAEVVLAREGFLTDRTHAGKALMDNDYAADGYARDMELEHIYAEAEKRLK